MIFCNERQDNLKIQLKLLQMIIELYDYTIFLCGTHTSTVYNLINIAT